MGVTPVAIDEQTRFTNPYLVLCHSRCGSSTEWEPRYRPFVPHAVLIAASPHLQTDAVSLLHMATHQLGFGTTNKGVSIGMKRGNQLFMSSE